MVKPIFDGNWNEAVEMVKDHMDKRNDKKKFGIYDMEDKKKGYLKSKSELKKRQKEKEKFDKDLEKEIKKIGNQLGVNWEQLLYESKVRDLIEYGNFVPDRFNINKKINKSHKA